MAKKRIAIVGQITIATLDQVEDTPDGYRVTASQDYLAGAGKVANDLHAAGTETLLLGVCNESDVVTVRRMTRGHSYIMGDRLPTLRWEFVGLEIRIDRGERPVLDSRDAARIVSQIQQFRPDEIRLINADDLVLQAICETGQGGLIYREMPEIPGIPAAGL